VPEISRFFGIIIAIYHNDHPPPHFHARYGEHKALVAIDSLTILRGSLPPRVLGLVVEWASGHRDALLEDWELAWRHEPLKKIPPLE